MTKLNSTVHNKLTAQAEEAKERGLVKMADHIKEAIGNEPESTFGEYSYNQLENDIHRDLWKIATHVMKYYNVEAADAQKLDNGILLWASELIGELESVLNIDSTSNVKGPFEPKVPGEK